MIHKGGSIRPAIAAYCFHFYVLDLEEFAAYGGRTWRKTI
jgi:hypothetical protein